MQLENMRGSFENTPTANCSIKFPEPIDPTSQHNLKANKDKAAAAHLQSSSSLYPHPAAAVISATSRFRAGFDGRIQNHRCDPAWDDLSASPFQSGRGL